MTERVLDSPWTAVTAFVIGLTMVIGTLLNPGTADGELVVALAGGQLIGLALGRLLLFSWRL